MDKEIFDIMKIFLLKLIRMKKIGGSHTEIKNLTKGLPFRYTCTKKGQKAIEKAIKELVNIQFLLTKSSTGELHISINPRKTKEIQEFLRLWPTEKIKDFFLAHLTK